MVNVYEGSNKRERVQLLLIVIFIMIQIQLSFESAPGMLRWEKETLAFIWVAITGCLFIFNFLFKVIKVNPISLVLALLFTSSCLLSMMINDDFYSENLFFIIAVVSGFLISLIINRDNYLQGYVVAIVIYSAYSLLATYIILPLHMNSSFNLFKTYESILGVPFVDMWLSFSVGWHGLMRNQGIFREPGVFQFFILVALVIEVFYFKNKNSQLRILVLIVTLITTFSTVGLICLVPILIAYIFVNKKKLKMRNIMVIGGLPVIVCFMFINSNDIMTRITNSFSKLVEGSSNLSFQVRLESIYNNLVASLESPIFGKSFVNGFHYIQDYLITFNSDDITGTMFSYIMALGYFTGLIILFTFYRFCSELSDSAILKILIFIILFLSINTQNLVFNSVIWTFMFLPFAHSDKTTTNLIKLSEGS
ncbi:hypothetical protein RB620_14705 [Paenibacillus sp. LHD-117]|uniref:hypothetical protein n=1 Tax=Paenibacillus sp. LHD-117 TaxID=3071412 RepID=UPI0027E153B4|nr:hypothetical protein [Paenibacillus sp. LHD-117]MDQ6420678.1 hypothetical protein [Paenibacillus sp. LHD-117]